MKYNWNKSEAAAICTDHQWFIFIVTFGPRYLVLQTLVSVCLSVCHLLIDSCSVVEAPADGPLLLHRGCEEHNSTGGPGQGEHLSAAGNQSLSPFNFSNEQNGDR